MLSVLEGLGIGSEIWYLGAEVRWLSTADVFMDAEGMLRLLD